MDNYFRMALQKEVDIMNVYDFDYTLYQGDSTIDFWLYELVRYPSLIRFFPHQILYAFKYLIGSATKESFKEEFYIFFKGIKAIDSEIQSFCEKNGKKFNYWYYNIRENDDVVISASPEFIVKAGCEKIGIKRIIASKVDRTTGKCEGKNCKGLEKVKRFKEEFGNEKIQCFYSDSKSDAPMATMAEQAFLIKKSKITVWDSNNGGNV